MEAEGFRSKRQQSGFLEAERADPEFAEKGSIITAYHTVIPGAIVICVVICVDEMGPIAVKTFPGVEWKESPNRAAFEPNYGRRGKCKCMAHLGLRLGKPSPSSAQAETAPAMFNCWKRS